MITGCWIDRWKGKEVSSARVCTADWFSALKSGRKEWIKERKTLVGIFFSPERHNKSGGFASYCGAPTVTSCHTIKDRKQNWAQITDALLCRSSPAPPADCRQAQQPLGSENEGKLQPRRAAYQRSRLALATGQQQLCCSITGGAKWQTAQPAQADKVRPTRSQHHWPGFICRSPPPTPPYECNLSFCSYVGRCGVETKGNVFTSNEQTRWESQWKGWHLPRSLPQQQDRVLALRWRLVRSSGQETISISRFDEGEAGKTWTFGHFWKWRFVYL